MRKVPEVTVYFWIVKLLTTAMGEVTSDYLVNQIDPIIAVALGGIGLAVALVIIFAAWYMSEKTLSIHSISTRRRELFYWATVMTTFALGTAAGDMTAATIGLSYFSSGVLFAVCIAVPVLAYWLFGLNELFAFWLAYILTRPLGASFADWMGKSAHFGGLGV